MHRRIMARLPEQRDEAALVHWVQEASVPASVARRLHSGSQRRSLWVRLWGRGRARADVTHDRSTARQRLPTERSVCRRVPVATVSTRRLPQRKDQRFGRL